MISSTARSSALFAALALAFTAPLLFGRALNVHGDPYTLLFAFVNIVPLMVVGFFQHPDITQPAWLVLASVVFWGIVGACVAQVIQSRRSGRHRA